MNNKFKVLSTAILLSAVVNAKESKISLGAYGLGGYTFGSNSNIKIKDVATPVAPATDATTDATTDTTTDATTDATTAETNSPAEYTVESKLSKSIPMGAGMFASYNFDGVSVIFNAEYQFNKMNEINIDTKEGDTTASKNFFKIADGKNNSQHNIKARILAGYDMFDSSNITLTGVVGGLVNISIQNIEIDGKVDNAVTNKESVQKTVSYKADVKGTKLSFGLSAGLLANYEINENFTLFGALIGDVVFGKEVFNTKKEDNTSVSFGKSSEIQVSFRVGGLYQF